MKYGLALLGSGIVWFGIVRLCRLLTGSSSILPVAAELFCSLIAAVAVGCLFREKITSERSWRLWLLLPLETIAAGVAIYGFSLSLGALVLGTVEGETEKRIINFLMAPVFYVAVSFTYFLPLLYPAALVTNGVLRCCLKREEAADR